MRPPTITLPSPPVARVTQHGVAAEAGRSTQAGHEPDLFRWVCGMLQLNDAFYPTGAYAHSFGLEGLIEAGVVRDRETLRSFFHVSALPALRQVELPLVIHSWHALESPDWERVGEISILGSSLKSAREARLASENIGRQRVEMLVRLRGSMLAQAFVCRAAERGWPYSLSMAAAMEARELQAPLDAALASIYYAAIAGLLAAAMKLLRIGQTGSQTLLTELLAAAPRVLAGAQTVSLEDTGWYNPWLDIVAARHETAAARLFIS